MSWHKFLRVYKVWGSLSLLNLQVYGFFLQICENFQLLFLQVLFHFYLLTPLLPGLWWHEVSIFVIVHRSPRPCLSPALLSLFSLCCSVYAIHIVLSSSFLILSSVSSLLLLNLFSIFFSDFSCIFLVLKFLFVSFSYNLYLW